MAVKKTKIKDFASEKEVSSVARNVVPGNWMTLMKPSVYHVENLSDRAASIKVEPLPHGFGQTIGNSLRRIMLSSLYGAAVVAINIEGVGHEYSAVPGMREDVVDLVLNIKKLVVRYGGTERKRIRLEVSGPCVVTAGMIEVPSDVEIVNKDHVLCSLDKGASLKIEMYVMAGRGYVSAEDNRFLEMEIGVIPIDSIFTPVNRVMFKVENSRVGSDTEYDKLMMSVETNGSISPEMAVGLAARILQEQLHVFVNFKEIDEVVASAEEKLPFDLNLLKRVEDLELSVRSHNCLKNDNVRYIGDLVVRTESEMLRTPNFGRKSLNEIRELLSSMGLRFGMEISDWPPSDIEEMIKKYEERIG
jgi:DNA-directed RNA polymerase subunit alpha